MQGFCAWLIFRITNTKSAYENFSLNVQWPLLLGGTAGSHTKGTDLSLSFNFLTKHALNFPSFRKWFGVKLFAQINKFRCSQWRITIKNKTNAQRPQWPWCRAEIKIIMFFYITKHLHCLQDIVAWRKLWTSYWGQKYAERLSGWGWHHTAQTIKTAW